MSGRVRPLPHAATSPRRSRRTNDDGAGDSGAIGRHPNREPGSGGDGRSPCRGPSSGDRSLSRRRCRSRGDSRNDHRDRPPPRPSGSVRDRLRRRSRYSVVGIPYSEVCRIPSCWRLAAGDSSSATQPVGYPATPHVRYDGRNNEALRFAATGPYTLGSGLNRPEGCSSNWQSAGLQNRMLWVRVPPPLPTQEECS